MFSAIRQGKKPTEVFKELVGAEPGLNNWELASRFVDSFENISGEAVEIIWHWQRLGGRPGLADDKVDAMLLKLLLEAGYIGSASE